MTAPFNTIDLSTLGLKAGEGKRVDAEAAPADVELGGQTYRSSKLPVRLDVSKTAAGHALRVRFAAVLEGPCMRCLEPATASVEIDAGEVDHPSAEDEELTSPYVVEAELDLAAWAHDALLLGLPQKLLCRPDCAGLCPECGVPLNGFAPGEHTHEQQHDPRWAKLRELLD